MTAKDHLAAFVLLVVLTMGVGCAAALAILPKVLNVITEAVLVVDEIADFVHAQPLDQAQRQQLDASIARTRGALARATRAVHDDRLTPEQADAALAPFRTQYAQLIALTAPLGVKQVTAGAYGVQPDGLLFVPEPMALSRSNVEPAR